MLPGMFVLMKSWTTVEEVLCVRLHDLLCKTVSPYAFNELRNSLGSPRRTHFVGEVQDATIQAVQCD